MAELRFSMQTHGASVVVSVQGELDITSSQRFDDRLAEAAAASDQVILDMSAVDFMDTTALAVIVTHWRRQAEEGGVFLLAGARYRYTKALWITGLADRLPMYDTVDDALAGADTAPDRVGGFQHRDVDTLGGQRDGGGEPVGPAANHHRGAHVSAPLDDTEGCVDHLVLLCLTVKGLRFHPGHHELARLELGL